MIIIDDAKEIKSNNYHKKWTFDNKNARIAVFSNEITRYKDKSISEVRKGDIDGRLSPKQISELKELIEQRKTTELIADVAEGEKKFNVLAGIAYTQSIYGYLASVPESVIDKSYKDLYMNMNLLYNTLTHFKNQLSSNKGEQRNSNEVSIDRVISKSDDKEQGISNRIVEEELDVYKIDINMVKHDFKIYLDFLNNIINVFVSNRASVDDGLDLVYTILKVMWYLDSYGYYNDKKAGRKTQCYPIFNCYSDTQYKGQLISDGDKQSLLQFRDNRPRSKKINAHFRNIEKCVLHACRKTLVKYNSIALDPQLGTNPYLFARYLYFAFTEVLGIELFQNQDENYTISDLDRIVTTLNPTVNEKSLAQLIPSHKFSPKFFNNVNTLQEWFTKDISEVISNDYSLSRFKLYQDVSSTSSGPKQEVDTISSLSFSYLNHSISSITNINPIVASKEATFVDYDRERREILQLIHLKKLVGTSINGHTNTYQTLINSKINSALTLEGYLRTEKYDQDVARLITTKVEEEENAYGNEIIYKILGFNVRGKVGMDSVKIVEKNVEPVSYKPNIEPANTLVKKIIDTEIKRKIHEIAKVYQDYYFKNSWNMSFMGSLEEIEDMITATLKDDTSGYKFLLGDCLTLLAEPYYKVTGLSAIDKEPRLFAVTTDYMLVCNGTKYELKRDSIGENFSDYRLQVMMD